MTLPPIIYCQDCHKEGRQTPATWALPDPRNSRKADFYCNGCVGTDIDQCETIEAYRKMVEAESVPEAPKAEAAVKTEPTVVCNCGKPFGHRGRCKGVKQGKRIFCDCGRPAGHKGRHRGTGLSSLRKSRPRVIEKTTAYTATEQPKPNGHIDVGGFRARVITAEEYRASGMREHLSDLDPIVDYVRTTMKAGTVTLFEPPKGKSLKSFRERVGRALQKANKLPVRIELRTKEKLVAVIREAGQ